MYTTGKKSSITSRKHFTIRESLIKMIEEYIVYYNNKRLQRKLGVVTPMEKYTNYLKAA